MDLESCGSKKMLLYFCSANSFLHIVILSMILAFLIFFLCFGIGAFVICFKQAILKRLVNDLAAMCGLVVPIALAHAGCILA